MSQRGWALHCLSETDLASECQSAGVTEAYSVRQSGIVGPRSGYQMDRVWTAGMVGAGVAVKWFEWLNNGHGHCEHSFLIHICLIKP